MVGGPQGEESHGVEVPLDEGLHTEVQRFKGSPSENQSIYSDLFIPLLKVFEWLKSSKASMSEELIFFLTVLLSNAIFPPSRSRVKQTHGREV